MFKRNTKLFKNLIKTKILFQNENIPVYSTTLSVNTNVELENVFKSDLFINWKNNIEKQNEYKIKEIDIQSVDYFGKRIGFLKLKANCINSEGISIPGISFLRGGAVGILIILKCENEEYVLLTEQPRLPIGDFKSLEIPAGMIDNDGNFSGKAAEEIKEETSIEIKSNELIDLTSLSFGNNIKGIYSSGGGSDEFLRFYLAKKEISKELFEQLQGKLTGLRNKGEFINLKIIKLSNAYKECTDIKFITSLYLYEKFYLNKD
eukprot:gene1645-12770_t